MVSRELELWTSIWRDILLLKHDVTDSVANIAWIEHLARAASAAGDDDARIAIEAVAKAADGLRRNGMARVVLEVLMLELPTIPSEIVESIELGEADESSDGGWDAPAS
jgi:hypothetical protein